MNAHYTTFEGKEQFEVLIEKASQLGDVSNYFKGDTFFGFDSSYCNHGCYFSYNITMSAASSIYQGATYLPYNKYLDYLDRCIKERDV